MHDHPSNMDERAMIAWPNHTTLDWSEAVPLSASSIHTQGGGCAKRETGKGCGSSG